MLGLSNIGVDEFEPKQVEGIVLDRDTHRMRDACTHDDRILLRHRELELVRFADVILHRRLHEKPAQAQIQQRDRNVEWPHGTVDASENLDARIATAFGSCAHL